MSYHDGTGRRRRVPSSTLRAALSALGTPSNRKFIEPCIGSFEPEPCQVGITLPEQFSQLYWRLAGSRNLVGEVHKSRQKADVENRAYLDLGMLPTGYYSLEVFDDHVREQALIIRAPEKAWLPKGYLEGKKRDFGIAIQLYEMVGPQSLGIGDFSDLAGILREASRIGASAVGVNPLHALPLGAADSVSPYSPSSRYALHPLYLDLNSLKGVTREWKHDRVLSLLQQGLNESKQIDYHLTWKTKLRLLEGVWRRVIASDLPEEFVRFRNNCPYGMEDWAQFECLSRTYGNNFSSWPGGLSTADLMTRQRWSEDHLVEVNFYLWLQWQLQCQLSDASAVAKRNGMAIGTYRDLAIGSDPWGAESWSQQRRIADGLEIGAPPDALNPAGQNWGFPVINPSSLSEAQLEPFIHLIRSNMKSAGALRIDHILGLARLFVIPKGLPASQGTYLSYPLKALTAVLVLESHRAQCLVIGEDLGTVPRGLRPWLALRGILSYRLLYFEQNSRGRPRRPEHYPNLSLSAVGNHDVAPFCGWWQGKDLELFDNLKLWPSTGLAQDARVKRRREKEALQAAFERSGLSGSSHSAPAQAAYQWLARSDSALLMVQPEDALEIDEPVNVPGTNAVVPNWSRRRMPPWPQWFADPRWCQLITAVKEERGIVAHPEQKPAPTLIYRVQLSREFSFKSAARLSDYLSFLGVSDLYFSPVFQSVSCSLHGYDVTDSQKLDAGRGGEQAFYSLQKRLQDKAITYLLDFVPNHMAAHESNRWWFDLMQWGPRSPFAGYFDVDWSAESGKLLLPIIQRSGYISEPDGKISFTDRYLIFKFQGHLLPLSLESYGLVFNEVAARASVATIKEQMMDWAQRFGNLRLVRGPDQRAHGIKLLAEFWAEVELNPRSAKLLSEPLRDTGSTSDLIDRIVSQQHWRLRDWKTPRVNYRRFADIDQLVGLRIERPETFAALHSRLLQLTASEELSGIRLDHIDGLATPAGYLNWLQSALRLRGCSSRLWVEKVLMKDEELPPWPISGTTGYDFLNDLTCLFLVRPGLDELKRLWERIAPHRSSFGEVLQRSKKEVLRSSLRPALERVLVAMGKYAPLEQGLLCKSLETILINMPVYRIYPGQFDDGADKLKRQMRKRVNDISRKASGWLIPVLFDSNGENLPAGLRDVAVRFWQLSASLMAKGLEDRAFYRYLAVPALCEVGGDPRREAMDVDQFHDRMRTRIQRFPATINATTTHDTKRSEDSRYRLAVLTVHAREWSQLCDELGKICYPLRPRGVSVADEYLVWQTLLATWPVPIAPLAVRDRLDFGERMRRYLIKALREANNRTSWQRPNDRYEQKILSYFDTLIDPASGHQFQQVFLPFLDRVAAGARDASLIAVTLKFMAPGIPDLYQGCELWNLTLVDPDNRQPVDYKLRTEMMQELLPALEGHPRPELVDEWYEGWADGRIKFYLTARLARLRLRFPDLFSLGSYLPIEENGCENILSFRRQWKRTEAVVTVRLPRVTRECPSLKVPLKDGLYIDWLRGTEYQGKSGQLLSLSNDFPVSVLLHE